MKKKKVAGQVFSRVLFISLTWGVMFKQAGNTSAATADATVPRGHPMLRMESSTLTPMLALHRVPIQPAAAEAPAESASEAIEKAKRKEIVGFHDDERTTRKFLELVVLPLGVCLLLITVLRRGL